ncbi:MAG: hypothetical protein GC154_02950 [bacterium]|nr:hypothetical protein [bacterium]
MNPLLTRTLAYALFTAVTALAWAAGEAGAAAGPLTPFWFEAFARAGAVLLAAGAVAELGRAAARIQSPRVRAFFREAWAPLALAAVSAAMFHRFWAPGFPVTIDHTSVMLRFYLTELALIKQGTLLPWSGSIGAGIPLNDLYPPGAALLYCGLRALTFYTLGLAAAYKLLLTLTWAFFVGAAYVIARRWFGVAAGFLTGLILTLDPLNHFVFFHCGGYSQELDTALISITVVYLATLMHGGAGRPRMAGLALLIMAALLIHVFALPALMLFGGAMAAAAWLQTRNTPVYLHRQWRNLLFFALGFGLTAWWLVPFIASSRWTQPYGMMPMNLGVFAIRLLSGHLNANFLPIANLFIIAALAWGAFSARRPVALIAAAGLCGFILDEGKYELLFSPKAAYVFSHVPAHRFWECSYYLGAILAGGMTKNLLERVGPMTAVFARKIAGEHPSIGGQTVRLCALAAALAFTLPLIREMAHQYQALRDPFPISTSETDAVYQEQYLHAVQWIDAQGFEPVNEDDLAMPLLYPKVGVEHAAFGSTLPFTRGWPIVGPQYMPTMIADTRSTWLDLTAPGLSGMKYLICNVTAFEWWPFQQMKTLDLNETGRWESIGAYQAPGYRAQPWEILNAPGATVELTGQEPGRISFHVSGVDGGAWLRVGVARYRKWKAFVNGEPAPIQQYIRADDPADAGRYIAFQTGNGNVELRYAAEWIDYAGYAVSIISALILIAAMASNGSFRMMEGRARTLKRLRRLILSKRTARWASGVLIAAAIAGTAWLIVTRHGSETRAWYVDVSTDRVGKSDWAPDQLRDLEFGVWLGPDCLGKTLDSIDLVEEPVPAGRMITNMWTTRTSQVTWKLLPLAIGEEPTKWVKYGAPMNVTIDRPVRLRLYAANPYFGDYIPDGTMMRITLRFHDGSERILKCALRPQGYPS